MENGVQSDARLCNVQAVLVVFGDAAQP